MNVRPWLIEPDVYVPVFEHLDACPPVRARELGRIDSSLIQSRDQAIEDQLGVFAQRNDFNVRNRYKPRLLCTVNPRW